MFRECGFADVHSALSGELALNAVRSRRFGLVLSDVSMEGMSGVELLEHVRADPALRRIPFMLMTALRDYETLRQASRLKADSIILKPFTAKHLRQKLQDIQKLQAA